MWLQYASFTFFGQLIQKQLQIPLQEAVRWGYSLRILYFMNLFVHPIVYESAQFQFRKALLVLFKSQQGQTVPILFSFMVINVPC